VAERPSPCGGLFVFSIMTSHQSQFHEQPNEPSIAFSIASGDYFANLATVLDLLRQGIYWKRAGAEQNDALLSELRDELLSMQKHYKIIRKR
jgi:hypothetical protein